MATRGRAGFPPGGSASRRIWRGARSTSPAAPAITSSAPRSWSMAGWSTRGWGRRTTLRRGIAGVSERRQRGTSRGNGGRGGVGGGGAGEGERGERGGGEGGGRRG